MFKMYRYDVVWSPEGRVIATVTAQNPRSAIRKAPLPYRKYLGELHAKQIGEVPPAQK